MTETLRVMPREMRLMSERILSLTGLPKGFALMVQDHIMYSQMMKLGGFALLEHRLDDLQSADPARIRIVAEEPGTVAVDAMGEHAWFVVPVLVDLLAEGVAKSGAARVMLANVADPQELRIATGLARRVGLSVVVAEGEPVTASAVGAASDSDPVLADALENGAAIAPELWWRIYHLAQTALTPDSVVSRRHAGPLIVTEDGKVIGRSDNDDDTDISFLKTVTKLSAAEDAR